MTEPRSDEYLVALTDRLIKHVRIGGGQLDILLTVQVLFPVQHFARELGDDDHDNSLNSSVQDRDNTRYPLGIPPPRIISPSIRRQIMKYIL